MSEDEAVWIFTGAGQAEPFLFPSAVFVSFDEAEFWIQQHQSTGTLTQYPLDTGAYDWAIEMGHFEPEEPDHRSAQFIETFSHASQPHTHYENGERL